MARVGIEIRRQIKPAKTKTSLKSGDLVMVVAGGNKKTRPNKGSVGKILRFTGDRKDRVVVEGLNLNTIHQKAKGPDKPSGKIRKEGSIHISNVMFYAEKLKKPVKLSSQVLADGTKVRGFINPETEKFEQIVEEAKGKKK